MGRKGRRGIYSVGSAHLSIPEFDSRIPFKLCLFPFSSTHCGVDSRFLSDDAGQVFDLFLRDGVHQNTQRE